MFESSIYGIGWVPVLPLALWTTESTINIKASGTTLCMHLHCGDGSAMGTVKTGSTAPARSGRAVTLPQDRKHTLVFLGYADDTTLFFKMPNQLSPDTEASKLGL